MKNFLLGILSLAAASLAHATNYNSISSVNLQSPSYLFNRTDDPTLKGYFSSLLANGYYKIGVADLTSSSYSAGINGSYGLVDSVTSSAITIPANSIVDNVKIYSPTAVTSGVTVSVGYSGSNTALVPAMAASALTTGAIVAGTPISAATSIARTSDTPVTLTLTGATAAAGKVYVLMHLVTGLN